jgi:hypothetical protein
MRCHLKCPVIKKELASSNVFPLRLYSIFYVPERSFMYVTVPAETHVLYIIAIHGPLISTATYVLFLMRAD